MINLTTVTPDMLKDKPVLDKSGTKVGIVHEVVREKYKQIAVSFLEVSLEKRIKLGPPVLVKVRTRDADMLPDGSIKVNFSKEELKTMAKEQELQKHPPTV